MDVDEINVDDITLDMLRDENFNPTLIDVVKCPECKALIPDEKYEEDEEGIEEYSTFDSPYNERVKHYKVTKMTCPYCDYTDYADEFYSADAEDLIYAPNAKEFVPDIDLIDAEADLVNKYQKILSDLLQFIKSKDIKDLSKEQDKITDYLNENNLKIQQTSSNIYKFAVSQDGKEIGFIVPDTNYYHLSNALIEAKLPENLDKKLVTEGKLVFKRENITQRLTFTDDGKINLYKGRKLKQTEGFSKKAVNKICLELLQEGYVLQEATDQDNIKDFDYEQTKQNLEQSIEKVDELQNLKNELTDKVNNLVNENVEEPKTLKDFPSTEITQKPLTKEEVLELNLENDLTLAQKDFIIEQFGDLEEFEASLKELVSYINSEEPITSIEDFIIQLF